MKKVLSILLTAAMILSMLCVAAVSTSAMSYDLTVNVGASSYGANIGDVFYLNYYLKSDKNISAAQLEVPVNFSLVSGYTQAELDTNIKKVMPVTTDGAMALRYDAAAANGVKGYVLSFASANSYTFGDNVPFVSLKFKVLKKGTLNLNPVLREVVDADLNDLVDVNGDVIDATFSSYCEIDIAPANTYTVATPRITSITSTNDGLKFAWSASSGAGQYRIFKWNGAKWATLATVTGTSYTDKAVTAGEYYKYTVRAMDANAKKYVSDYVRFGWRARYIGTPAITKFENTVGGQKVTWGAQTGAAKYRVFLKKSSKWTKLADTTKTSYTYAAAASGTKYTYTVRCMDEDGNFISGYNTTGFSATFYAAPTLSSVANSTTGVVFKYTKPTGAAKIRIFRKVGTSGWAKLKDTTATSYTDTTVQSGVTYSYTARSLDSNGKYISGYDTTGKTIRFISAPVITTLKNTADGISLVWTAGDGAENFRVFRKSGSGGWAKVADTAATSYIDATAEAGVTYYYTVRCISADGKTYTSAYDTTGKKIATTLSTPAISTITNVVGGVKLGWNYVNGAVRFRIFRKSGSSGWAKIADTNALTYTDDQVTSGTKYYYTVRCITADGKSYTSSYNTTGWNITYVAAPTISKISSTASGVSLTWGKSNGAAKYRVFRKSGTSGWAKLADTTSTSYVDKTAVNGTKYSYTIRCMDANNNYVSAYNTTGKSITYKKP